MKLCSLSPVSSRTVRTLRYAMFRAYDDAFVVSVTPYAPTEIARLQNSLKFLKQTQEELHSFAREDPGDADIKEAVDENEGTMYAPSRTKATLSDLTLR